MTGSDLPARFGPVGFRYNINKLILTGGISLNVNDLCHFSSPVEEKKKLLFRQYLREYEIIIIIFIIVLEFFRSCS